MSETRQGPSRPRRWRTRVALTILSAVLLVLSFPPFDIGPLAWFSLIPFFAAVAGTSPRKAFILGYLCGSVFFFGTIWWLIHVTLPGMIALGLYLALYFALFGLFASLVIVVSAKGAPRLAGEFVTLAGLPSAWVALEFARASLFTGFGWELLGYSQYRILPVIQCADITGVWGVSFLIVLMNAAFFLTLRPQYAETLKEARVPMNVILLSSMAVLFLAVYYGSLRLANVFTGVPFRVSVIQGNIPQKQKWNREYRPAIIEAYERLSREASAEGTDLIVWPETALPGFLNEEELYGRVSSLARESKTPLLAGVVREEKGVYFNSAVLFDRSGDVAGRYDKMHLVPFGEYIPCKPLFSFVEKFAPVPIGDCSPGTTPTVFRSETSNTMRTGIGIRHRRAWVHFSCLICFEDIFPGIARAFVSNGATALINITNDAWYLDTAAPFQHAQASVFRAVETRTSVVRAANTGYSCFIDEKGKITGEVSEGGRRTFVRGRMTREITVARRSTPYIRYGDYFAWAAVFVTLAIATVRSRRYLFYKRRKTALFRPSRER